MKLKIGAKVSHPQYGEGIVLDAWRANGSYGSNENYAIRFLKGGPMGWADKSTNDPKTLVLA